MEGYHRDMFLLPPPDDYLCCVCELVLREPHQLKCCGATLCKVCLVNVDRVTHDPDDCDEPGDANVPDKRTRSLIKSLMVKCTNRGCDWTGELFYLEEHQKTQSCPLIDEEKKEREMKKEELKHKIAKAKEDFQDQRNKDYRRSRVQSSLTDNVRTMAVSDQYSRQTSAERTDSKTSTMPSPSSQRIITSQPTLTSSAFSNKLQLLKDSSRVFNTSISNEEKHKNPPTNRDQHKSNEELLGKAIAGDWDSDSISSLVASGASVNCTDRKEGKTPLHFVSKAGIPEAVEQLLLLEATPDAKDKRRVTPLHLAARHGHLEVVELLLAHNANVNLTDTDRQTALHLACSRGHTEVVKELLECETIQLDTLDRRQNTALVNACIKGHTEIVLSLLMNGAAVNIPEMYQMTPLHIAAAGGFTDIVELLLDQGASPLLKDEYNLTALNWAILRGNTATADSMLLLSNGAGITKNDEWKTSTALIATVLKNQSVLHFLKKFYGITAKELEKYEVPSGWVASTDGITHKISYLNIESNEKSDIHPKVLDN